MVRKKVRWEDKKGTHIAYEGTRAYKERSREKEKEVTKPAQPSPIKLQQPIKAEKEKGFVGKALEAQKKIITSPITTVVLGTVAAALATAGLSTVPTATALGTRVGSILHTASIHHWSKSTGMLLAKKGITVSKVPILQTAARVGQPASKGIKLLFKAGSRVAINQKTTALATSGVSKYFTAKTLAFFGAWAGSVFIGKWGLGESPEPIMIPIRDAIRQAEETGDWSIADEALEAAKEISNPSIWEEIGLWSPFSAIIGAAKKLKGAVEGIKELAEIIDTAKTLQTKEAERIKAGEPSEFEKTRIESDEAAQARKEEFAEEESKRYKEIQETNLQRDVDLANLWNDYYAAIRNKNWIERDRILNEIENYGK